MKKADIQIRDGNPAINVKVHGPYPFFSKVPFPHPECEEAFTREWLESRLEEDDSLSDALFQMACESAWEMFTEDAREIFPLAYGRKVEIYAEGRSGGWAVVVGLPDVESWDGVMVAKWSKLCRYAAAYVDAIPYEMAALAYLNVWLPEMEAAVDDVMLGASS